MPQLIFVPKEADPAEPRVLADGTVYVEATDNLVVKLYKIAVEDSGPANSPWPMKGQNIRNTAVAPE